MVAATRAVEKGAVDGATLSHSIRQIAEAHRGRRAYRPASSQYNVHGDGACPDCTYSAPFAGNHEILGLLVGESDQTIALSALCPPNCARRFDGNALHGSLGDRYPTAVQILLESLIQLIETTELEFGH